MANQQYLALQNNKGKPLTTKQQKELKQLKERLDIYLNPWPEAFLTWFSGVLHLDFGKSIQTGEPITARLVNAAGSSIRLFSLSLLIGAGIGIPLGIYAAYKRGTWKDKIIQLIAVIFTALPGWFFIILVKFLNLQLWLATDKNFSILPAFQTLQEFRLINPTIIEFWQGCIPVFFLSAIFLALFCGQTRSQILDVLNEDYVRTARAKGLPGRTVLVRHVFRNSLSPLISTLGGLIPFVFGAQILIEKTAGWSGLGVFFSVLRPSMTIPL